MVSPDQCSQEFRLPLFIIPQSLVVLRVELVLLLRDTFRDHITHLQLAQHNQTPPPRSILADLIYRAKASQLTFSSSSMTLPSAFFFPCSTAAPSPTCLLRSEFSSRKRFISLSNILASATLTV